MQFYMPMVRTNYCIDDKSLLPKLGQFYILISSYYEIQRCSDREANLKIDKFYFTKTSKMETGSQTLDNSEYSQYIRSLCRILL